MKTTGNTVLCLDNRRRDALIEEHRFFVDQAKQRLLDQFSELSFEYEAQRVSEEAWENLGFHFDPERHDPAEFEELASHVGYERYRLLSQLREHVRFSIITAFYHAFEKSLKEWIAHEIRLLTKSKLVERRIWSASLDELFTLLKHGGCNFFVTKIYSDLRRCRLAVNAYKHGEGPSFDELKRFAPEMIIPEDDTGFYKHFPVEFFDHSYLRVRDEDFDDFSAAIILFWETMPEYIRTTDFKKFPKWLEDAATGTSNRQRK